MFVASSLPSLKQLNCIGLPSSPSVQSFFPNLSLLFEIKADAAVKIFCVDL